MTAQIIIPMAIIGGLLIAVLIRIINADPLLNLIHDMRLPDTPWGEDIDPRFRKYETQPPEATQRDVRLDDLARHGGGQ